MLAQATSLVRCDWRKMITDLSKRDLFLFLFLTLLEFMTQGENGNNHTEYTDHQTDEVEVLFCKSRNTVHIDCLA